MIPGSREKHHVQVLKRIQHKNFSVELKPQNMYKVYICTLVMVPQPSTLSLYCKQLQEYVCLVYGQDISKGCH